MNRAIGAFRVVLLVAVAGLLVRAQETNVYFRTDDPGVDKAIRRWGLDVSWPHEGNTLRGISHLGLENVHTVRLTFYVDEPLTESGDLSENTKKRVARMVELAEMAPDTQWTLMPHQESGVHAWYKHEGRDRIRVDRWVAAIKKTVEFIGKPIVLIEAYNEPDFRKWGQTGVEDLHAILKALNADPMFKDTATMGPSTLSSGAAQRWFDRIKDEVDIATTHCLGGDFASYRDFVVAAKKTGKPVYQSEAHNLAEVIAAAEYGVDAASWWPGPFLPRGHFVRDSQGKRLAYSLNPKCWTAAAVYRSPKGELRAFLGASERQSERYAYRLVCGDRPVWFNGEGPAYMHRVPLGRHDEETVDITFGEEIPQHFDGKRFLIVNRASGDALEVAAENVMEDGAAVRLRAHSGDERQVWELAKVKSGYYLIRNAVSGRTLEAAGWDLRAGGQILQWGRGEKLPTRWFMEKAGDGYVTIRSALSCNYLHSGAGMEEAETEVVQWSYTGGAAQQWRLFPVAGGVDYKAPQAPSGLRARGSRASVHLSWQASREGDIDRYIVYRSADPRGEFDAIGVTKENSFVDTSPARAEVNYYAVRATDRSWNHSDKSSVASAKPTGDRGLVMHLAMDGDLTDSSENGMTGHGYGGLRFVDGKKGQAVALDGISDYVGLAPKSVGYESVTVATWVYWYGGARWQRLFDFGNDTGRNFFMAMDRGKGMMRVALQNGRGEQAMDDARSLVRKQWTHVAVVSQPGALRLYVNGKLAEEKEGDITLKSIDPVCLWLGKSSYNDPLFAGRIDDLRVYNYGLTADEVSKLATW